MKRINGIFIDPLFSEKQNRELVKLVKHGYFNNIDEIKKGGVVYKVYVGDMNKKNISNYLNKIKSQFVSNSSYHDNVILEPVRDSLSNKGYCNTENFTDIPLNKIYETVQYKTNVHNQTILYLSTDDSRDTILHKSDDAIELDMYFGYFSNYLIRCLFENK